MEHCCPVCGHKMYSACLGWICPSCKCFVDMKGVAHPHKEEPFMPPQTNADRIQSMTDEELSGFLYEQQKTLCIRFAEILKYPEPLQFDEKADDLLEWLKQEAQG